MDPTREVKAPLTNRWRRRVRRAVAHLAARGAVSHDDCVARVEGKRVWTITESDEQDIRLPESKCPSRPPELSEKLGTYVFPRETAILLDDVELLGRRAVPWRKDLGFLLAGTVDRLDVFRMSVRLADVMRAVPPLRKLRGASPARMEGIYLSLVNHWCNAYFHWILECLPLLRAIEPYKGFTGVQPRLLTDPEPPRYVLESLDLLGYSATSRVGWTSRWARAEGLICCSSPRREGHTSRQAVEWLRTRVRTAAGINERVSEGGPGSRLYVSRRHARSRCVLNEDDVVAALQPLGFEIVFPEKMPFVEQVNVFARARFVLGPHGAGLTNVTWASGGLVLLELFGALVNPCYMTLAAVLGHRYDFLLAQSNGEHMVVDVPTLRARILELINRRDNN